MDRHTAFNIFFEAAVGNSDETEFALLMTIANLALKHKYDEIDFNFEAGEKALKYVRQYLENETSELDEITLKEHYLNLIDDELALIREKRMI